MLVGEPGIGKTRAAQELETYARMRGAQVLWGRSHESSGAPAYWPWVQALRSHIATADTDILRSQLGSGAVEVARVVSEVRERLPEVEVAPPIDDANEARFRLFDSVSSFLRATATETPLVLALDDLHWADGPTLLLLTHVAREIGRAQLLIVGTYRDTDLDRAHPLSHALAEMNREQLFQRVLLRGLTRNEVASYVRAAASFEPPAALLDRVYEEPESNPFFLSEVVALMAQEGALSGRAAASVVIPEGVREVLGRRLDRLSEDCDDLVTFAAVAGREFRYDLLSDLTGHDDEALLLLVEEALEARVIAETGVPGEYRFTHALMQETLLGELSITRQVRLHGAIASALERLHADDVERHAAALAHHFLQSATLTAEHAAQAIRYSKSAAEQAERQFAWDEAIRHLENALSALRDIGDPPPSEEAALLATLGRCQIGLGGGVPGRTAFARSTSTASSGRGVLPPRPPSRRSHIRPRSPVLAPSWRRKGSPPSATVSPRSRRNCSPSNRRTALTPTPRKPPRKPPHWRRSTASPAFRPGSSSAEGRGLLRRDGFPTRRRRCARRTSYSTAKATFSGQERPSWGS